VKRILHGLAIGAHLLTHQPADAATTGGQGATTKPPPRPTRIDATGGAIAYLVESHELPLVDLSISFRSGAALEPTDKHGVTRLFARMLRRGAAGRTSDDIEAMIDRLGGEIAIEVSASSITMHAQVIRRNLEPFLALVTDLLVKPTFPEDELARLRREAVAELIEARDSDKALASKFFRRAVFGKHPYGRGTSGTVKTIPTIIRADVVATHALHIKRGNVVVGVAGDVSEADVRKFILPMIAAIPEGASVADETPEPTFPKGRRLVFIDKPARSQTQIMIGALGTHARDPDHFALHVANTVFGGTFTARLMKEVRSVRGWSYGASSRMPIDRRREGFSMWTFPAATDAAACIALELGMLEELIAKGITDQELSFAKSYLSESYAFDVDTAYKRVRQAVDEEIYGLPADYHTGYVGHVQGVTLAQANASLGARLSASDLVVVVVGTASEIKDAIAKEIPKLASTEVIPFDAD
jgi:zinc protease